MTTKQVITDTDFAKLVKMTKLTLSDDEKKSIHAQLDEALKAVEVFDELDLKDVPPLSHPGNLENVMREDVVGESFTQEESLQNASATHDGYFMVAGVLEDQT
ncbi:MAG: Asp-tRNA(Asn)/Glu-tRNA(Gln) amidotransferase subunit GatC [Microgenomates group bacterium]